MLGNLLADAGGCSKEHSKWPNLRNCGDLVVSLVLVIQALIPHVNMKNAHQLWNEYHAAVGSGNNELAQRILKNLQAYSGTPPGRPGGCAKCNRNFR